MSEVMSFISKIKDGTYSETYLQDALRKAELMDWTMAKNSRDALVLNGYIQNAIPVSIHLPTSTKPGLFLKNGKVAQSFQIGIESSQRLTWMFALRKSTSLSSVML